MVWSAFYTLSTYLLIVDKYLNDYQYLIQLLTLCDHFQYVREYLPVLSNITTSHDIYRLYISHYDVLARFINSNTSFYRLTNKLSFISISTESCHPVTINVPSKIPKKSYISARNDAAAILQTIRVQQELSNGHMPAQFNGVAGSRTPRWWFPGRQPKHKRLLWYAEFK